MIPFTLRAPGIFTCITHGCSRKEWGLPALPGAACSLSRQQRLCVWNCCADTDCSGIPLGESRLGNFGVQVSFLTRMLGYWVLHSHRSADGQSSGGSFLLSSHQPWTPVLVAELPSILHYKRKFPRCAQTDWLKYFGFCCAEQNVLVFIFWGVLDLQVWSRGKSLSYFGI